MTDFTSEELEREMQDLWLRRGQLTQAEHARFYRLVNGHLLRLESPYYWTIRRCQASGNLEELKERLIADFYCDVIYLRARKEDHIATPLAHRGALTLFYKRWLIDQVRICLKQLQHEERHDTDDEFTAQYDLAAFEKTDGYQEDEITLEAIDPFIGNTHDDSFQREESPRAHADQGHAPSGSLNWSAKADREQYQDSPDIDDRSADIALANPDKKIHQAARDFLDKAEKLHQEKGEAPWILLFLGCHHCPEDPEESIPMSLLRDRHDIPNYHGRARKLGITSALGGFPSLSAFAETYLGQWLREVGFRIALSELSEIGQALKILCAEALIRVKARKSC